MVKEDKIVPIRGYARAMVKTMEEANKIPHFGYCDEVGLLVTVRVSFGHGVPTPDPTICVSATVKSVDSRRPQ